MGEDADGGSHLKDFKRKQDGYEWVNPGDGDVDWEAVREAFREIGYTGSATVELQGGDEAYLRDVSPRRGPADAGPDVSVSE